MNTTDPIPAQLSTRRKYKHFSIPALPPEKADSRLNTQFFYVGDDILKIDSLIKTFKNGYAVEHTQKAIRSLRRIAEGHEIPDIIIVDADLGENQLKLLSHFVSNNDVLKRIPYVLEASGLSETELKVFSGFEFLDEIIFLDRLDTRKLMAKIHFLRKVKFRVTNPTGKQTTQDVRPGFDNRILTKRFFRGLFRAC